MMLPKRKPTVNKPRMPPTIASPHAFRCTATMPPTSVKIERTHPIIPQVSKIDWSIDWSCSIEKGESGGSALNRRRIKHRRIKCQDYRPK